MVNEVSANQHNADDVSNNENVEVNISADATEELVTTPEVEVLLDNLEESDEPGFASSEESAPVVEMAPSDPPSTIGRAIGLEAIGMAGHGRNEIGSSRTRPSDCQSSGPASKNCASSRKKFQC